MGSCTDAELGLLWLLWQTCSCIHSVQHEQHQYQFVWRSNLMLSPIMHVISMARLLNFKTLRAFVAQSYKVWQQSAVRRWATTHRAETNVLMAIFSPAASYLAKVSLERVENVDVVMCVFTSALSANAVASRSLLSRPCRGKQLSPSTRHLCVFLAWSHFVIFRCLSS